MAKIYPDLGHEPLLFSAASGAGSRQSELFTTDAPGTSMNLTFVVFFYPNANNTVAVPEVPTVEIQTDDVTWQAVDLVAGFGTLNMPGGAVNYTFSALASNGVYQIHFTQNNAPFGSQAWAIRFTNVDGSVSPTNKAGVTFIVDSGNALLPWIAVPGQGALTNAGPPALDFGLALTNLTLSGTASNAPTQLVGGKTANLTIPVGNYGPGALTITGVSPSSAVNNITLTAATPLTIAPGATATLSAAFAAPGGGQTATPTTAAKFELASNDAQGGPSGANAHFDTITLNASAGNFEIVLALDLSGSMAATDAGGMSRWNALQIAAVDILNAYHNFAAPQDKVAIVLYPAPSGASIGKTLQAATPIAGLDINATVAPAIGANTPIDSTPMLGSPGAQIGGIYVAAGDPSGVPQTNCGQFATTGDGTTYLRNFRWLILMSDGAANVGEDPKTVFAPGGSRNSYFKDRNIRAITLGYGKPASGQVDGVALQTIAAASSGHYVPANPQGLPSESLGPNFYKTLAAAMGFSFAADPDATLDASHPVNRHKVTVGDHDITAAFLVWYENRAGTEIAPVQLVSPLGEVITRANAAGLGIAFVASPLCSAYYVSAAALDNGHGPSRRGVWTIVVGRGSVAGSVRYAYAASLQTELSLVVTNAKPRNFAGDRMTISAALSLRGSPVAGAHVVAEVVGADCGFDNWLAAQYVSQTEFVTAQRKLIERGMHDVQALYIKAQALEDKGVVFPGIRANSTRALEWNPRTGTYDTTFDPPTLPGSYRFLVSAKGQDDNGNVFARQQTLASVVETLPDAASTLVSISYQLVGGEIIATLTIWPRDRFGNVYLTDPAISQAIAILLSGGAVVVKPLQWNLDGSYTEVFSYPVGATPGVSVVIGGVTVVPSFSPPDLSKLVFVDEVMRFKAGREARSGANTHRDPSRALGDPSKRPSTDFVSLGGLGLAEFAVKGVPPRATAITIFIANDLSLRPYVVEALPARAGVGWVEIGRAQGETRTFSLVPKPVPHIDAKDWVLEVEGRLAGETFDVEIPLAGKLHVPDDPLRQISGAGIARVRVRDLSDIVTDPNGEPSASPGVSVQGIGFTISV